MKLLVVSFCILLVLINNINCKFVPRNQSDPFRVAEPCNPAVCQLPDCRCSSTEIPGGLNARDTPQFVMITFDDGINIHNIETYRRILYNRFNSNGCRAGTTFYVSHEYSNYHLVNELHQNGFEIALHSITHSSPNSYWSEATYDVIKKEFGDQKRQLSYFANVPIDELTGIRLPFLQMTGDMNFKVMADEGILYDSSWSTSRFRDPGVWPYTLDYASTQDCNVPPCATGSIPGVWELPMISWLDNAGGICSMVDACFAVPALTDEDGWFRFILKNFESQYLGNRSPFGFFVHEWWVSSNPAVERALVRFMDMVNGMSDVFMVNSREVVDWVRNPVPINEYRQQTCRRITPSACTPNACGPLYGVHNSQDYWMTSCRACPAVYPWVGNPYGLANP